MQSLIQYGYVSIEIILSRTVEVLGKMYFIHIGWLGFLDSDGAFATGDVESVIKMTSQIKEYDALYTSRKY